MIGRDSCRLDRSRRDLRRMILGHCDSSPVELDDETKFEFYI